MYKVAYVSGSNQDIAYLLRQTINDINLIRGRITQIVQSQSTQPSGQTIVTVTIIYEINL